MGIPGLTTYINEGEKYLEDYKLHDTYLLIDGYNVSHLLYSRCINENWAFGGDYDIYAQCVSDFFDDLFKCNVIPLVLIEDGVENRNPRISIRMMKERIDALLCPPFEPNTDYSKIFPLLQNQIFFRIIEEKNIRYLQCILEVYHDIAVIAKILDCPILSCQSDFYMFGCLFIPFHTFDTPIVKNPHGNGYMKPCKIYKIENLFKCFQGLNETKLVLAAILLDEDEFDCGTFKNFFRYLNLKSSDTSCSYRRYCIDKILSWLSKYTLNSLITAILCRVTIPERQKILILIEMCVNGAMNEFADVLMSLGFSKDYVTHLNTSFLNRNFKYDVDINTLRYVEEPYGENDRINEEQDDDPEIAYLCREYELLPKHAAITNLPTWFVDEYRMGKYPTFIVDLVLRRLYICPIQMENYFYADSAIKSFKILSVIIGILRLGINSSLQYVTCIMRNQNNNIVCYKLQSANIIKMCKLPSLFHLNQIPLYIQKDIINNTLGIRNTDCINELPAEWRLFQNWKIQKSEHFSGYVSEVIQRERKKHNYSLRYTMDDTFMEAYNKIDYNDCVLAAPFFVHHFEVSRELIGNQMNAVLSVFASCLRVGK
ncbi:Protein asteroid [Melipona quadrifasciata]|uniref:Protein asteroid n=1 Tax=Melipona quadrifasciata TaxID=166423 RepID=A0A0M8ZPZ6_9HYME|nr:Protein asteroid [Melipona quadrifasciata]